MPVLGTHAHDEVRREQQHGTREHEPAGTLGVEDWANLDAEEEGSEGVDAEDPADGALRLGLQLMGRQPGVVRAERVHVSQGGHQPAKRAQHT